MKEKIIITFGIIGTLLGLFMLSRSIMPKKYNFDLKCEQCGKNFVKALPAGPEFPVECIHCKNKSAYLWGEYKCTHCKTIYHIFHKDKNIIEYECPKCKINLLPNIKKGK